MRTRTIGYIVTIALIAALSLVVFPSCCNDDDDDDDNTAFSDLNCTEVAAVIVRCNDSPDRREAAERNCKAAIGVLEERFEIDDESLEYLQCLVGCYESFSDSCDDYLYCADDCNHWD